MSELLVLTATHDAFRHQEAIDAGVSALCRFAEEAGLGLLHTDDPAVLNPRDLADTRAVVFHQCNGEILDEAQRAALVAAVVSGCGFAGIHNSTGAERSWPGYLDLIGARFTRHPPLDDERRLLRSRDGAQWWWSDEWYEFEADPVGVEAEWVLADEPGRALVWRGSLGAGRTWYTALGHRASAYSDPAFMSHLTAGISWVLAPPAVSPRSAR